MRILLPISAYPPEGSGGGLASFYGELAQGLVAAGHEAIVSTLSPAGSSDAMDDGVRVIRHAFDHSQYARLHEVPGVSAIAFALPIAVELYRHTKVLRESIAPDVIECVEHGFQGLFFVLDHTHPVAMRCLCPQSLLMKLDYNNEFASLDVLLTDGLECAALSQADSVSAPSMSLAGIVAQQAGIDLQEIEIIKNPLKTQEYAKASGYDPADAFPKMLFVGRVERLKGCDLLVEALPSIVARFPKTHLVFVGGESQAIGESRTYGDVLRERLSELNLGKHVTFKGRLPRTSMQSIVRSADMAIFPSRYDSSPYACLEAMSFECPVIASRVGGIPEYIQHAESGWLVEPENPSAIAEAVIQLCLDDQVRNSLAANGLARVKQDCSLEIVVKQTVGFYRKAIDVFNGRQPDLRNLRALELAFEAFDDFCGNRYLLDDRESYVQAACSAAETAAFQAGRDSALNLRSIVKLCLSKLSAGSPKRA